MLRVLLTTVILTYLWTWLFWKIVVEKPHYFPDDFRNPFQEQIAQRSVSTFVVDKSAQDNPDLDILIWFGTFTYLLADIWRIWFRIFFNIDPPLFPEDDD